MSKILKSYDDDLSFFKKEIEKSNNISTQNKLKKQYSLLLEQRKIAYDFLFNFDETWKIL